MFGLRNDYLNKISVRVLNNKKCWQGVFSCDKFKRCTLQNNQAYICNLSASSAISGGSHYVAISIKDDRIYYFDSFGVECYDVNILENMKKSGKKVYHSNMRIQSKDSLFCGYFCLAFLLLSEMYPNPISSLKSCFNKKNLIKNEFICINIIKKALKKF